ncbi:MAG: cyclase family protein [Rhizobiales bacterium]|nr:cyclase family protein [Hyphomicrobiales bacterium]
MLLAGGFALSASAALAAECTPSKWGKDDQIGAANYVKPDQVMMAAKLIKKGETHPLGIVVDPNMPAFPPRKMMMQVVQPNQQYGRSLETDFGWPIVYNDDVTQLWWGTGPQIDGLGHLGEEGMYYNCNEGKEFAALTGLKKLGIHTIPPLVGRGVMIDMAKHNGVAVMDAGQGISSADIKAAASAQGVELRQGDVVLFHTGWTDGKLESDPKAWVSAEPGLTNEAAEYLASLNVMAVGADTWGVEAVPPVKGDKVFYGHVTLLKKNGIYILETMNTGRLAKEGVHEFMFVLGQARLQGAVQMIINPVAMW